MTLDALLKLLPNTPWVTLLLFIVILYLVIERVFNFTTSISDRRSDQQLLNRAKKAASILEKLPANDEARFELLAYIAAGPYYENSPLGGGGNNLLPGAHGAIPGCGGQCRGGCRRELSLLEMVSPIFASQLLQSTP